MIVYQEIPPSPYFSRCVECFWGLESRTDSASASPERILPDGRIEIVFNLADPFKRYRLNHQAELQPKTIVIGQMRSFATIEPTGRVQLFGIRFKPGGACALFNLPLAELTDNILPLVELWRTEAKELEERLHDCSSLCERAGITEAVLMKHLLRPDNLDVMIEEAVRRIHRASGCLPTASLVKGMGISERQLERRFHEKVGLSPKQFSRVIRFQKLVAAYEQNQLESWCALAHDCGYYDQAHLIRDFKAFSGRSPAAYFEQELDLARYFTRRDRVSDFYNTQD